MGMDASKLTAGASVNTACEGPGGAGTGSVTRVVAGTGISVSPPAGTGVVTVTNTAPAPAFGGAPPAVAAASSAGAAATTSRSDHTHQGVASVVSGDERIGATTAAAIATIVQSICATWSINNVRWYALDGVAGNDANAGFSDVSAAAAGAVAVRTWAKLNAILPVNGAGRQVVVLVLSATYAENTDALTGRYGYRAALCRATATNSTAGSVAFADSAQDRILCGAVTATGMNAAGYNPTAGATTTSIPCQLNGGGAAGFPAAPALPDGARIRFDSATSTAALRNVTTTITHVTGGNTIVPLKALPAVPAAADVFYIEMPGALVNMLRVEGIAHDRVFPPFSVAGIQAIGAASGNRGIMVIGYAELAFCHSTDTSPQFIRGGVSCLSTRYVIPGGAGADTTQDTGGLCRFKGQVNPSLCIAHVNPGGGSPFTEADIAFDRCASVECQPFVTGGSLELSNNGVAAGDFSDANTIGTSTTSIGLGFQVSRILSATAAQPAGLVVLTGGYVFGAIDITGVGAKPAIKISSTDAGFLVTQPITGSTGNTDVGLDLTKARGCTIVLAALPTVTGTAGDVRLADGTIVTWAQVATTGFVDSFGNAFINTNGAPTRVVATLTGLLKSTGDGSSQSSYMANPGINVLNAVNTNNTPSRFQTSMRFIRSMRVTLLTANVFNQSVQVFLCKATAPVASGMGVAFVAGAGAGAKQSDLIHAQLFLDGEDFDVLMTENGDTAAGSVIASVVLEGW